MNPEYTEQDRAEDKFMHYDEFYMDIARRVAKMSHAVRAKVGCLIVLQDGTMSPGWNGMPAGMDNTCEHYEDAGMMGGTLVTNPEVSHAEENAIAKLARSTHSSNGATAYVSLEPCMHCAKLLYSAGIKRVVIGELYRNHDGTDYLRARGINVSILL